MSNKLISIIGTVGVPANYGGFETLVENLVRYHDASSLSDSVTVYCSSKSYVLKEPTYLSANLKYIPLNANGVQSVLYDIASLLSAAINRTNVILLLGVSGAVALPLIRLVSSARIVTNIDGIEWRREKWRGLGKYFLRFSERMAVHFSHEVISDNDAIAEYLYKRYGADSYVVAYGGDHAVAVDAVPIDECEVPNKYAFSVCRIEPENNVHMIVESFLSLDSYALVMVGNWDSSDYGKAIRDQYASHHNLFLVDPIYDLGKLKTLRSQASFFVHGHSAGGTNPSLVEAMHFGRPIMAFDCNFNRSTTENKALFFNSAESLIHLVENIDMLVAEKVGQEMLEIAKRRYTWDIVSEQYFSLCSSTKKAELSR